MNWRTSSYSDSRNCVQAGHGPGTVAVRDSALPGSPVLKFSPVSWREFTTSLKEAP